MDFSFSFMQGIMGNTIQQPPQLIDSANNRQDDANSSDQADEGGHTPYDSGFQPDFQYHTPTTEDLPPLTNGYQSSLEYDSHIKYQAYSQFPNGSANGYGSRNFANLEYYHHLETAAMRPHEGVVKSSPPQPTSPPTLLQPPPSSTTFIQKKTGSPEIKLRITKTIQNGREMFESSLCGDLLHEFQASEINRKKHERRRERKEKRKKSSKHHHHHHHHREEVKVEEPQPNKIQRMETQEEEIVEQHFPSSPLSPEVRTGVWFHVGDLVWSKVGTYPWWPCMVSCDPQLHVHSKINSRGAREYHVQFFSNEPERAWIHEKRMREYRGRKQYDQLVSEDAARTHNQSERLKMKKPRPQKERIQWEIGIAHAEKALRMTREERIEQYTFIYIDPETSPEPKKPTAAVSNKRCRRSTSSSEAESARSSDITKSPLALQSASSSSRDSGDSAPETRRQSQRRLVQEEAPPLQPPPVKTPWKTAAARKSLPASVLLHKGTIDLQKCNMSPVVKIENVLALKNASEGYDQFIFTTKGAGSKPEITIKTLEKTSSPSPNLKVEKTSAQHTPAPETSSGATGTLEKKHQRRSNRTRSESEKSLDSVPKKKVKKEQVEDTPLTAVQTGLQKGASEISDACKPLKKRSRASTDVELANSSYRDASDSDSRGLNDAQICFDKPQDSPSANADADASDVQSVDSSISQRSSKRDTVCQICENYGESLVSCNGDCSRLFHLECLGLDTLPDGKFICMECKTGLHTCFSCKIPTTSVRRCSVVSCGKYFHESCARQNSATVFDSRGFRCPHHCCSSCTADKDMYRACKGRMLRCVRCPVAYHSGDNCVAAGSLVLTCGLIVCSNHSKRSGHSSVNVSFCFVCARGLIVQDYTLVSSMSFKSHYLLNDSKRAELMKIPMIPSSSPAFLKKSEKGGKLLCCESCPAAFHPSCLNMEMPQGSWSCNDCRTGKKLHYKQIVWVKLGNYRWWPAEICNPRSVPLNIQALKHDIGDFPVFFFGSHDYYWVHQGRVFPYVEGDKSFAEGQTSMNKTFKKALEEAAKRFQELKAQRESKEALEIERNSRKPPPYKHIKTNKPVGKIQIQVADISEIPRCNCRPTDESPCGLDSQCLNRMLLYECHPQVCPAGERCQNQNFTRRLYPEAELFRTERRGWGLLCKRDIRKGEFVNEYVGELIDEEECRLRLKRSHENGITNFYLLTVTKDRIIDAGPKGNYSRFMNHSCNPNCETQKWTVNGDVRVGLFALCDITQGTELTFNYNLDCLGNGRTECHCGAENCSGFLGVRPKTACATATEEKVKNARLKAKKRKIKTEQKQMHEDFCFHCGDGGELVMCDKKDCPKAYHLLCLNLTQPPYGKWDCPWHQCDKCGSPSTSFCEFCPSSFCREHEKGELKASSLEGRLCCSEHDPKHPLAYEEKTFKFKTESENSSFPSEF